jgi:hypothetical protein
MTSERVDPLGGLDDFAPKSATRPVERAKIDLLAEQVGFPSRQPQPPKSSAVSKVQTPPPQVERRVHRRFTTGRNQQINIKATAETIARLNKIADDLNVPLGEVLERALAALEGQLVYGKGRPE